jgi:hypothetical protein
VMNNVRPLSVVIAYLSVRSRFAEKNFKPAPRRRR